MKLYMIILGCQPKGRFTEQRDVFFGIGNAVAELAPQMSSKEQYKIAIGKSEIPLQEDKLDIGYVILKKLMAN